jgi:hypothetical protein
MYLIINKTTKETLSHKGNWPYSYVESLLDKDDDFIVISLYSNTVKIPCGYKELNSIKDYQWKEFPLPLDILSDNYISQMISKNSL